MRIKYLFVLHFSQQPRHRQVSSYSTRICFHSCLRGTSRHHPHALTSCFVRRFGYLVYEGQCIIIRISGKVPGTRCDRFLLSHSAHVCRRLYLPTAGRYDTTHAIRPNPTAPHRTAPRHWIRTIRLGCQSVSAFHCPPLGATVSFPWAIATTAWP